MSSQEESSSASASVSSSAKSSSQDAYPQFILFGDSITQQAEPTFALELRTQYLRRLDVVNRGFSGYTSELALDVLPKFFPSNVKVRVMTVFFGANDACLPGNSQHVPIERYESCMRSILQHELVRRQATKVVLIVPGPVDEWQLYGGHRTATNTKRYADTCRQLGEELKLPIVDLWTAFMKATGWKRGAPLVGSKDCDKSDVLGRLLSDGLHFTAEGYEVLFKELLKVLRERLPEELPDNIPFVFPGWGELFE